jgi:TRAP-type C4-dicarboxylate transport system substrate-binding protein
MIKMLARCALFSFAMSTAASAAEPVRLKLAFFTSDRATVYLAAVKPFVDAVNAEAKGLIQIEVYFSGALGRPQSQQAQLVVDDIADIAFVVPGTTPERFLDTTVVELPGLYHNMREASLVYTRLIAANALKGYEEFFAIGAYAAEPEGIHGRRPIAALSDLKGMKIRTNNLTEAAALEKLGARAIVMPVNLAADAISSGSLDGATVPPSALLEFGISRVVNNHYLIHVSAAPLALLMNRKKFDGLPVWAQNIIRKYSGEWAANHFIATYEIAERQAIEQFKSDPRRKVVLPAQEDLDTAQGAFNSVIAEWAAKSPHNHDLLKMVETELAQLRATR